MMVFRHANRAFLPSLNLVVFQSVQLFVLPAVAAREALLGVMYPRPALNPVCYLNVSLL